MSHDGQEEQPPILDNSDPKEIATKNPATSEGSALRAGGNVAVIGVLTGAAGNVPTASILMKAVGVRGVNVGSRRMFEDLNRALSLNPAVRPVVDREFRFEELPDALRHLKGGAHFGKVVLAA